MNIYFEGCNICSESKSIRIRWGVDFDDKEVFCAHELSIDYNEPVNININHVFFIFMNTIASIYCKYYIRNKITINFPLKENDVFLNLIKKYQNIDFYYNFYEKERFVGSNIIIQRKKSYLNGLFFGGGKDSLVSALIQKELYGSENLALLRLVWDENYDSLSSKREAITNSLSELEQLGIDSYFVDSNYHSIVASRSIGKLPNLALYPGLMLPLIDSLKVMRVVNGYDASEFYDSNNPNKTVRFLSARPKNLKYLSDVTSLLLDKDIYYRNYNYGILPNIAFEIISKQFSENWKSMYMCERISGKWCIKCRKCFTYALACLAYEMESDFNLGYFFQNSIYVKNLLKEIQLNLDSGKKGLYINLFSAKVHFLPMINLLKKIDLNQAKKVVHHPRYSDAWTNFMSIIDYYAETHDYTEYDTFWGKACIYEMTMLNEPNIDFEKERIFSLITQNEIAISFKNNIKGVNGLETVSYNYFNRNSNAN